MSRTRKAADEHHPRFETVVDNEGEPLEPASLRHSVAALVESLSGIPIPSVPIPADMPWLMEDGPHHVIGRRWEDVRRVWDADMEDWRLIVVDEDHPRLLAVGEVGK